MTQEQTLEKILSLISSLNNSKDCYVIAYFAKDHARKVHSEETCRGCYICAE